MVPSWGASVLILGVHGCISTVGLNLILLNFRYLVISCVCIIQDYYDQKPYRTRYVKMGRYKFFLFTSKAIYNNLFVISFICLFNLDKL